MPVSGTNNEAERTLRPAAQARMTGRTSKTIRGARRQTIIASVLESLRQHLTTMTLPNVIAEVRRWMHTGRSCFADLLSPAPRRVDPDPTAAAPQRIISHSQQVAPPTTQMRTRSPMRKQQEDTVSQPGQLLLFRD